MAIRKIGIHVHYQNAVLKLIINILSHESTVPPYGDAIIICDCCQILELSLDGSTEMRITKTKKRLKLKLTKPRDFHIAQRQKG